MSAFLLRYQDSMLPEQGENQAAEAGKDWLACANSDATVTEVKGEEPRRDPKKATCAVFPA